MLKARWKGGSVTESKPEPIRAGQIRSFKIVKLDPDSGESVDFIRNTKGRPLSKIDSGDGVLERPIAVKFTKDGDMYIVDHGRIEMHGGREEVKAKTGKIFLLRAPVQTEQ